MIALVSALLWVGLPLNSTPTRSRCDLAAADAAYFQEVLDTWATITRDVLGAPSPALPWMVLFSKSCAYHLAPDTTTPLGRGAAPVPSSLEFAGRPVPVHALPLSDGVALPNDTRIAVRGAAFTSVYGPAGAEQAFFATALPDVWAGDPRFAKDTEDWPRFLLGVLSHELVHTRQMVAIHARLAELHRRFPTLPAALNDDLIQKKFEAVAGLEATVRAEIALLYAAAAEPDAERSRELAARGLALLRARRTTYFGDSAEAYSALEDVFLNMEGVACWVALQAELRRDAATPRAEVLARLRGNRRWWSQEEGLALFLLIERFVPGWIRRVFPPELASPIALLETVLASPGPETNAQLQEQVRKAESGFARAMADRDHAALMSFVAEDAVFFGRDSIQRGKAAIGAAWKPLFESPKAPFAWEPTEVEVLDTGALGMTSGPVYDASGKRFGTFNSVWRRQKDGTWRIVLDKGFPYCDSEAR